MRWDGKLAKSEQKELSGYYSGRRLLNFYNVKTDWEGNPICPGGTYVEFWYSEELLRPEFINVQQELCMEDFV